MTTRLAAALVATLTLGGVAQQTPPVFTGTWTATGGPQRVMRGTWSAQALPDRPDAVQGSWTLVNAANQVIARGTWAARKDAAVWRGTWSAQAAARPSRQGQPATGPRYSGSWEVDARTASASSLAGLFARTLAEQVSGTWKSGGRQGGWSLDSATRSGRRP